MEHTRYNLLKDKNSRPFRLLEINLLTTNYSQAINLHVLKAIKLHISNHNFSLWVLKDFITIIGV
jgi:hypothetical protein